MKYRVLTQHEPEYSIKEVSKILGYDTGIIKDLLPILRLKGDKDNPVKFSNLLELHVLLPLTIISKVTVETIIEAGLELYKEGGEYPDHPLLSDEHFNNAANYQSLFMNRLVELSDLTHHEDNLLTRLYLYHHKRYRYRPDDPLKCVLYPVVLDETKSDDGVQIKVGVGFSSPITVAGCISTFVINSRHEAGETIEYLSYDYEIPDSAIRDAIRFENRMAKVKR